MWIFLTKEVIRQELQKFVLTINKPHLWHILEAN